MQNQLAKIQSFPTTPAAFTQNKMKEQIPWTVATGILKHLGIQLSRKMS